MRTSAVTAERYETKIPNATDMVVLMRGSGVLSFVEVDEARALAAELIRLADEIEGNRA